MLTRVEEVKEAVIVLRPVYGSYGDSTELWTANGILTDRRAVRSVRKALARMHALDLSAQAETVARLLERQSSLPFYLGGDQVFTPFKMRSPVHPHDRSYGYVDIHWIQEVAGQGGRARLILKDGRCLPLLCTPTTAAQSVCLGQRLSAHLCPGGTAEEEMLIKAAALLLKRLGQLERILLNIVDNEEKNC